MLDDPIAQNLARLMDIATLRSRVIAGNLANQNTPGYKTRAVAFEDAFRKAIEGGGDPDSVEAEIYEPRTTASQVDGNDVAVDQQVLLGSENAFVYQMYSNIIHGRNRLINTAITSAP
jgi:flagellar basal-body rod protein FlgB